MPGRLTLHPARRPPQRWLLYEERSYCLGRDADCDLVLDDERVSRRHARVAFADGAWRITDLASKNGLAVNGMAAAEATLAASCWLSVGGVVGSFELLAAEAARRESAARAQRWASSAEHQRRLDPRQGLAALLDQILDSVVELSGAERAFVLLAGGCDLEVAAVVALDADALRQREFSGSVGVVRQVLSSRRAVAVGDTAEDSVLAARASVQGGGIRAVVCVPLVALEQVVGVIYADSRQPGALFEALDVEILEAFGGHAALVLELARLDRELGWLAATVTSAVEVPVGAGSGSSQLGEQLRRARLAAPGPADFSRVVPALARWSDVLAAHSGDGA
jgi:hypothetical protein